MSKESESENAVFPTYTPAVSSAPPTYDEACATTVAVTVAPTLALNQGFYSVDFVPETLSERFSNLVRKANAWLLNHPHVTAKTCETISFKSSAGLPDSAKVTFIPDTLVHCLRLWLIPQMNSNLPPTQLNYFNVMPKLLSTTKTNPVFEDMKTLLAKLNAKNGLNAVDGRIITVESLLVPYNSAKHANDCIEPDKLQYAESAVKVTVLRLFYIRGIPTYDIVGIMDFFPRIIYPQQAIITRTQSKHESFPDLVQQVAAYSHQLEICNIQSLTAVVTDSYGISCNVTSLRVVTLKPHPVSETVPRPYNFLTGPLLSKTFLPVQLSPKSNFKNWNEPPQFESIQQTMGRIALWAKQHGVKLVSAESKSIQMYPNSCDPEGPQSTDLSLSHDKNYIWIVRVYVDGVYPDPPITMCPISYRGWSSNPVQEGQSIPPPNDSNCSVM